MQEAEPLRQRQSIPVIADESDSDRRFVEFGKMARRELVLNTICLLATFFLVGHFAGIIAAMHLLRLLLITIVILEVVPPLWSRQLINWRQFDRAERTLNSTIRASRFLGYFGYFPMLASMDALYRLFMREGRYSEAQFLLKRWIAIEDPRRMRGSAVLRNNLACVYAQEGKTAQTKNLIDPEQCTANLRWGKEGLKALYSANLGYACMVAGNQQKAYELLLQAKNIRQKARKTGDELYANILNNLGLCCVNLGQLEEAEKFLTEALAIRRRKLPNNHIHFAFSFHNLGRLHYAQKRYEEAELQYLSAISVREINLPPYHPDLATTLECYAVLKGKMGDLEKAKELLERAARIRKVHAALEAQRAEEDMAMLPLAQTPAPESISTQPLG